MDIQKPIKDEIEDNMTIEDGVVPEVGEGMQVADGINQRICKAVRVCLPTYLPF